MKAFLTGFGVLALLALACAPPGFAQSNEELKSLRKDLEDLRRGQAQIQQELQEIKLLLRGRAQAAAERPTMVLSIKDEPFKGVKDARLTLVEFSDYQCPFCARHVRETLPQIERDYVATGKLKYVFRNFPIESIHPQAFKAHEAANCAGEQGKFWAMHDRLFANQQALGPNDLPAHARSVDLDLAKFQQCLDGGKQASRIRGDLAEGQKAGIQGTPTFFLAITEPDHSKVTAVRVIKGAQPYAAFKEAIDSLLSGAK
jgi:protein-disulfide isomerase